MNRQLTMVICRQLILICGKYKIYSNKAVKHLTRLTQHVPRSKANISLYYWKILVQHCNICDQLVCWSCVVFTYLLIRLGAGGLRTGAYTKRNMLTEVDHIGHKFVKYCRLKLAGRVMKYWLYFMAHVGWSELDVWPIY